MNEKELILIQGQQPVATISDEDLNFLICREFSNHKESVKSLLDKIKSDSKNGKNRISASILKLANKDLSKIVFLVKQVNDDFRDVVSEAEYPRAHRIGFELFDKEDKFIKEVLLEDWEEYSSWKVKKG